MVKFAIILILVGGLSLVLPFFGYPLKFENFLGTLRVWTALGAVALGALLLFAGFMTPR